MTTTTETGVTTQVYRVYIKATPQAMWDAITDPAWTERYGYGGRAEYEPDVRPGGDLPGTHEPGHAGGGRARGRAVTARSWRRIRRIGSSRRGACSWTQDMTARGVHAPHLRDRGGSSRRHEADPDPRARGCAEAGPADVRWHGGHGRRRRLELGPQRPQVAARDRCIARTPDRSRSQLISSRDVRGKAARGRRSRSAILRPRLASGSERIRR